MDWRIILPIPLFVFAPGVLVALGNAVGIDVPKGDDYDQSLVGKDLLTHSSVYFLENFNDQEIFSKSWIISKAKKKTDDGSILQYDGDWILEKASKEPLPNDLGLSWHEKARHRAISAKLFRDYVFLNRPLVVQYEVLHGEGQECGGAYLKLITKERKVSELSEFNDKTPYTIMFGPDKCGSSSKLHFIFRHKNPLNGSFEEKHCQQAKTRIDETFTDIKPHLFKLVINPDSTFSISVDHKVINEGSLLENFEPPVNPPRDMDDPNDRKPESWDDRMKIPDPSAKKPDDWDDSAPPQIPDAGAVKPEGWLEDEPINISDPTAEKPDDWDEEMDGEWEAPLVANPACEGVPGCGPWSPPLINNPDYKGKWTPPLIDNPNFKGIWKPRRIPNPDFFEDKQPYRMMTIDSIGFELWSVSARILFDNILITDDENVARQFASLTYDKKITNIDRSAETLWTRIMVAINYKPGWWALYFVYCMIPIVVYGSYLWRRVKEDTLFHQFVTFTNRYPWLWAGYVVGLLVPTTIIVVCCFWRDRDPRGGDEVPLLEDRHGGGEGYRELGGPMEAVEPPPMNPIAGAGDPGPSLQELGGLRINPDDEGAEAEGAEAEGAEPEEEEEEEEEQEEDEDADPPQGAAGEQAGLRRRH